MVNFAYNDWEEEVLVLDNPGQAFPPAGRFGANGGGAFRRAFGAGPAPGGFGAAPAFRGFGAGPALRGFAPGPAAGGFGAGSASGGFGDPDEVEALGRPGLAAGAFGRGFEQEAIRSRYVDGVAQETRRSEKRIAESKKKSATIKKTKTLIDDISKLHANQDMSDVVLIAEGKRFPAHKFLLSIRSNYFKAMFCTGLRESTEKEISLMDTPAKPFSLLLQYVYTGQMQLQTADYQQTLEVFALAHKYEFPVLQEQIVEHFQAILDVDNICGIYCGAELFSSQLLLDSCINFLKTYKHHAVASKHFLSFSLDVVKVIVEKVDWSDSEDVFIDNLKRWIIANIEQIEEIRPIIKSKQLDLVQIGQKLHLVKTLGVIEKED